MERLLAPGPRALAAAAALVAGVVHTAAPVAAATPIAAVGGPYTIVEGASIALDASGSSDLDGDELEYRWDLDGDGLYDDAFGVAPVLDWTSLGPLGIDDNGVYTVGLAVGDGSAWSTTATSLNVSNLPPRVEVSGPSVAAAGEAVEIDIRVEDPGDDDTTTVIVDWGDGTIDSLPGATRTATHTYGVAGMLRPIQVGVADEDGAWTGDRVVVPFWSATDKVRSFDTDGGGSPQSFASSSMDSAYSVAFGIDGLVYISGMYSDSVERYDPRTGAHLGTFVSPGSGGLLAPKGVAFGPGGDLLVASSGGSSILRYDGRSGAFLGAFVAPGAGGLVSPSGMVFGSDGNLYVNDQMTDAVHRFDGATGSFIDVFATFPFGTVPAGITFGPDGHLYSAANGSGQVYRRDGLNGADLGSVGAGTIGGPTGVRFSTDGSLWIAANASGRLERWDYINNTLLDVPIVEPSPAGPMQFAFEPDHLISITEPLVVNSTQDRTDISPGDGVCSTGQPNSEGASECTLRAALVELTGSADPAIITFQIPASDPNQTAGVSTISPSSALPTIPSDVVIDATSQSGWVGSPVVVLDGSQNSASALQLSGDRTTARGLSIVGWQGYGVLAQGSENRVVDNHIGVAPDGSSPQGNLTGGLLVTGASSLVRGNVISGNQFDGVLVASGGDEARIVDNRIGVDATGVSVLGNAEEGIQIQDVTGAVIGASGAGNIVGGNGTGGIRFLGGVTAALVQANSIGVSADGATALGNSSHGVHLVGANSGITIGGSAAEQNVIRHSEFVGVRIDSGSDGIEVRGNSIADNGSLGLDLDDGVVTANDAGDLDSGGNQRQNYPVISQARVVGGSALIDFTLASHAEATYRVDGYSSPMADASGHGEGRVFLGSVSVVTDAAGGVTATLEAAGALVATGDSISLVATDQNGNSSEFSSAATATQASIVVNSTDDDPDLFPGDFSCQTGQLNAIGEPECTLRAALEEANAVSGLDAIAFAIPNADEGHDLDGNGEFRITPSTSLPPIVQPVAIDGYSQAGAVPNTVASPGMSDARVLIEVRGTNAGLGVDGFHISAADVTIQGLAVNSFDGEGISMSGAGVTGTRLAGNFVGTDTTGTLDLGNGLHGIAIGGGASENVVGGTSPADRNVISGNGNDGVWLGGSGTVSNLVQGNLVGFGADHRPLGNSHSGVGIELGASSNLIGGADDGAANRIGHNGWDGLTAISGDSTDNAVVSNLFVANGGLAIDLGNDGVTPNDVGDADGGANGLLNFPVVTKAEAKAGFVTVEFELDAPAGSYRLESYVNPSGGDPAGHGEGEELRLAASISHTGSGVESFSVNHAGADGDLLSLTITDDHGDGFYGSTSEFSASFPVMPADVPGPRVTDLSARRNDVRAGGGLDPQAVVAGPIVDAFSFDGTAQRLAGTALEPPAGLTLSSWVRLDQWGSDPRLIAKSDGPATGSYELGVESSSGLATARLDLDTGPVEVSGGNLSLGTWHAVTASWDGTSLRLFLDGVQVGSAPALGELGTDAATPLVVGNTGDGQHGLSGALDHVEIAGVARSADWIATSHANVIDGAFVELGTRQLGTAGPWTIVGTGRNDAHSMAAPTTPMGADGWVTVTGVDEPGLEVSSWWWMDDTSLLTAAVGGRTGPLPITQNESELSASGWDLGSLTTGGRTQDAAPAGSAVGGAWINVVFGIDEAGRTSLLVDGVVVHGPTSAASAEASGSAGFRVGELPFGLRWLIDDVRLRRLVSDEPSAVLRAFERR